MFGFGRRAEGRAIQSLPWGRWPGDVVPSAAGVAVDRETSLQVLAVYGSVRLICDSIATLPVDVVRYTSDDTREVLPAPAWLEQPTTDLDRVAWMTQVLSSMLLDGNAFVRVVRGDGGRIVELPPLDASRVAVAREANQRVLRIDGAATSFEVMHIPALMLAGSDVGLSPVEAARQSIGLGLASQEFGGRFFGQGAVTTGVIEYPGELTPEQSRDLANQWQRRHAGLAKAHLPGVLQGGATWKPTSVTNEQAQFLETRGFTAAEIAGQMFLVDPSDLGIPVQGSSLTYANLEQRNARRVQVTLLPWIVRVERALSSLLAKPRYVKINVNGLLRGDTLARYQAYEIGLKNGFLVPNEPRRLEDLPPLDGGDEPLAPAVPQAEMEAVNA